MELEWNLTSEQLPKRDESARYSQVPCLCYKRYDWERGDSKGHYYECQILVFNHEHNCWDDASGDDYDCDIERVKYWMYLPKMPKA